MVDELWEDIVFDGREMLSLASLSPEVSERTLTGYGFSKTYGVAGLQIGYLVSSNGEMMREIQDLAGGVLRGASNLSMASASMLLSDQVAYYKEALLEHLKGMRDLAVGRLGEIEGVVCNELEGTYLLFPNISSFGLKSGDMTDYLLEEARVAVSDGSLFGSQGGGHIRINIGTSREILSEAFDRIEGVLSAL